MRVAAGCRLEPQLGLLAGTSTCGLSMCLLGHPHSMVVGYPSMNISRDEKWKLSVSQDMGPEPD